MSVSVLRLFHQVFLAFLLALILVFSGCEKSDKNQESSSTAQATEEAEAGIAKRGKSLYFANCIACHNTNPAKAGSVGPAISDSSKELLTLKVTQGTYPEGYQPKRTTKLMPPLPNLKAGIPFLHAFLKP
jgi:mono/diheme cytochrome c family protein